jgi:V/A-type H+-transporting ATPase subunit E
MNNFEQGEKLSALRDLILDRAEADREELLDRARREAQEWVAAETEKLTREIGVTLADAKRRSDEIRRRQALSAERERSTEALRLQNRLLQEAQGMLLDRLTALRDQPEYPKILAALAMDAAASLGEGPMRLRLAAVDAAQGDPVVWLVRTERPELDLSFDPDPAPILGGCVVESADGRRSASADFRTRAQEMADSLADRLLPLLQ